MAATPPVFARVLQNQPVRNQVAKISHARHSLVWCPRDFLTVDRPTATMPQPGAVFKTALFSASVVGRPSSHERFVGHSEAARAREPARGSAGASAARTPRVSVDRGELDSAVRVQRKLETQIKLALMEAEATVPNRAPT